ncbi:hypothetical protein [Polynucleobacter sp.]|jgi:hypothetical protein|uniref:hypothetical protein n=1 Tax=Polynucleobacter sp. TaxID=2029855 RepID=UPI0037CCA240
MNIVSQIKILEEIQFFWCAIPVLKGVYFRQGHPKGVACAPLTATIKETLFYAQGGRLAHWA